MTNPLLRIVNLSKRFGGLPVLEGISMDLEPGEVVGLVGRRGAGKSVLLHLLAGVYPPSSGQILLNGQPVAFNGPLDAQPAGVKIVYQDPTLIDRLDVIHNIFLGQELCWPSQIGWPDWGRMAQLASAVLADFDMPASLLPARISQLSDEQRQVLAIARVLVNPARLILMDDPLSALSFQRQHRLLDRIKSLAAQGVAVIITDENLQNLFSITDKIIVLYEGRITAARRTLDTTPREVVELIVGANRPEQVTPVIWALESYHAAQQQAEELRAAQESLRETLEAKDTLNRQLIIRLRDQVEALDHLNFALQDAHRRLQTEREEERKRLARELHDQVIQDLLSFNYRLEEAEDQRPGSNPAAELAAIRSGIRQVISDLRQLCADLRPPTIDSHGLAAAIRSYAQQWADQTGASLDLKIDPQLGRLPEAIELSVFRIVQEGLNNIRKHAQAQHTRISLQRSSTASLLVTLADDGRGMAKPPDLAALSAQNHFGLLGISERVALLGGAMQVELPGEGGVVLRVEIPSPYPSVN